MDSAVPAFYRAFIRSRSPDTECHSASGRPGVDWSPYRSPGGSPHRGSFESRSSDRLIVEGMFEGVESQGRSGDGDDREG
jgi:hypothetical protein